MPPRRFQPIPAWRERMGVINYKPIRKRTPRFVVPFERKCQLTDDGRWKCLECGVIQDTRDKASDHWKYRHSKREYPCTSCNASVPANAREAHKDTFHRGEVNGRALCMNCSKAWTTPETEAEHRGDCPLPNGPRNPPRAGWVINEFGFASRKKGKALAEEYFNTSLAPTVSQTTAPEAISSPAQTDFSRKSEPMPKEATPSANSSVPSNFHPSSRRKRSISPPSSSPPEQPPKRQVTQSLKAVRLTPSNVHEWAARAGSAFQSVQYQPHDSINPQLLSFPSSPPSSYVEPPSTLAHRQSPPGDSSANALAKISIFLTSRQALRYQSPPSLC